MTDLRPVTTSAELSEAIAESVRRFPGDPNAAAEWLRTSCAFTPEMALALQMQGARELGESN